MRTIRRASSFRKDIKKIKSRSDIAIIQSRLNSVVASLADDMPLAPQYADHSLVGKWAGYRECHIRPDVLLIYRKSDDNVLHLTRLGSHSELL